MDSPSGVLDVPTLETLGRRAESHPLVADWRLEPLVSPRRLVVEFDDTSYPARVVEARLDVRWFDTGDCSFHYVETHGDGEWQCRWDRHPKPAAPRAHVHPGPEAGPAEPSPLSDHDPLAVLFTVLDWTSERVATLFDRP